jgi:hypothetical protein
MLPASRNAPTAERRDSAAVAIGVAFLAAAVVVATINGLHDGVAHPARSHVMDQN